jgi:hypothetical protein
MWTSEKEDRTDENNYIYTSYANGLKEILNIDPRYYLFDDWNSPTGETDPFVMMGEVRDYIQANLGFEWQSDLGNSNHLHGTDTQHRGWDIMIALPEGYMFTAGDPYATQGFAKNMIAITAPIIPDELIPPGWPDLDYFSISHVMYHEYAHLFGMRDCGASSYSDTLCHEYHYHPRFNNVFYGNIVIAYHENNPHTWNRLTTFDLNRYI